MKVEHLLKVLDFFVWEKKHLIKMTFVNKGRRPERKQAGGEMQSMEHLLS